MTDITQQHEEARCERQFTECGKRFTHVEDMIKDTHEDTKQIIDILRGEGQDAGLVGRVQNNERRLNGMTKTFLAIWTFISAIIIGLFVKLFKWN